MSVAPTPSEIFKRASGEGRRRICQSVLELTATGFIAGFTIVFGIAAMGIVHSAFLPEGREVAKLAGAAAFALGLVLLVVQRAELFTENFFDPLASVFDDGHGRLAGGVARLWVLTLLFNALGGAILAWLVTTDGVLPHGARESLASIAEEIARRGHLAAFVSAIIGGALVASLSYALLGTDMVFGRILMAWIVGFLLAAGPFDHVVVTGLHLVIGVLAGASIDGVRILEIVGIDALGNLVGGVGLVTLSHVAQAKG
ncbi:formate/nitrite transporter family protein [Lysobacter korlensis]|uniref:Formate/nitrite transporter family protein n=1 Tax=Lysobacter korlensis TaxID=553636 RepID=A0ABV6S007_9GAMM